MSDKSDWAILNSRGAHRVGGVVRRVAQCAIAIKLGAAHGFNKTKAAWERPARRRFAQTVPIHVGNRMRHNAVQKCNQFLRVVRPRKRENVANILHRIPLKRLPVLIMRCRAGAGGGETMQQ